MTRNPIPVVYVTSNKFKQEENRILRSAGQLADRTPIADVVDFQIRELSISERLEIRIEDMVHAEVREAYAKVKVPCIVEHAGLIFDGHASYPGGLTKPMWNALEDRFVTETGSANRPATAKSVIAYCDGKAVHTFVGERRGQISSAPKGSRKFYWDTVFIPNDPGHPGLTYAEIVEKTSIEYKVLNLSQSTAAMKNFLEYVRSAGPPTLWS